MSTYLSEIQAINPQFIHRPGALIPVADALSRDSRFNQYCEVTQETHTYSRFHIVSRTEPFDAEQLQSDLPGRWKWSLDPSQEAPKADPSQALMNARIMRIHMKDIRQAQKEDLLCKRVYEHLDGVQLTDPKKDHEIIWNAKGLTIDNDILRPP